MAKRVLLVEDDEIIAFLHQHFIEKCGFETMETVDNGIEAIEEVKKFQPDAVLMDIRINGELDGIDTALKIREFSDAPIIFLTGNSDDGTLERAKSTSKSGYLIKPVRQEDLCEALAQLKIS
jgi:two-component system, response regulator PdtaR